MLSPKAKRNISRIIPFGVIWLVFAIVYTLLERGLLGRLDKYPSTGNPYSFSASIIVTPLAALVTGLLTGTVEILYFNKLFSRKSFIKKILYKSVLYIGLIVLFLVLLSAMANARQPKAAFFDSFVWNQVWAFLSDYSFLSVCVYITSIIVVTQFYTEISESTGQGVLNNFFTGKYHRPKEEERIFMFLDMKASTTIAESLGHTRYFEMLREYYSDLSDSIIQYEGEIYQYVGDEVIVSWTLQHGLHNNNCLQCFFAMKDALSMQAEKYNARFGLLPSFKAGFHFGKVTTGEIGALKKEIVFTGDTLNTTARIQGLCNAYNVDMLVSGDLVQKLAPDDRFTLKTLGEAGLRGRDEKIELFTVV